MGLFLQTAIALHCKEEEVKEAIKKVTKSLPYEEVGDLIPEECQYKIQKDSVSILFNYECIGYERLAKAISEEVKGPVMLLYIYDGDFWGYYFYDNGIGLDRFDPMPDYFEEVSEELKQLVKGNAEVIANYFKIEKALIEKYLIFWQCQKTDEKAYETDEYCIGESWQMADFMQAIGYPYEYEWIE